MSGIPMPLWYAVVVLFGVVVGIGASFTGLGGGFLMVPTFLLVGMRPTETVGTAFLATLITAISATAAHARMNHVKVKVGLALGIGGAVGAQLGARLLPMVSERGFKVVFALLLVAVAVRLAAERERQGGTRQAAPALELSPGKVVALLGLGAIVGVTAAFTGLGGGVIMVPVLLFLGLAATDAVGTSFLAILILAASALAAHARMDHVNVRVGITTGVGGIVGAQIGARLVPRVNKSTFRIVFAGILILLATRMLWIAFA